MTELVVDASVAAKWLFSEIHSAAATRLLTDSYTLRTPDLIWAEVGSVVWKKWRRREVSAELASDLLHDFRRFPLHVSPSEPLLGVAWSLAHTLDRSFYDSLYLALGASLSCPVVTADLKLYRAVRGESSLARVLWIEEIQ